MFRGDPDVLALHALISRAWAAEGPAVTFHVGDLHWRLRPQPPRHPDRDLRLWFGPDGALGGFAWFDPQMWGDIQCDPDADRAALEPQMLDWLEARSEGSKELVVGGFDGDAVRVALLTERGYRRGEDGTRHMLCALDSEPEQVPLPAGYSLRATREGDLAGQAQVIARAFEIEPRPVDVYRLIRSGPQYRNALDRVAISPAGQPAAFCIGWLDDDLRVGLLEPVGCDPDHRRRGLTRAVVLEVLRQQRALGATASVVCPESMNAPAERLYKNCGFRPAADDRNWIQTLEQD